MLRRLLAWLESKQEKQRNKFEAQWETQFEKQMSMHQVDEDALKTLEHRDPFGRRASTTTSVVFKDDPINLDGPIDLNYEMSRPVLQLPPAPQLAAPAKPNTSTDEMAGATVRALLPPDEAETRTERQARLRQAARQIRSPSYSLKAFHDDMVYCFPELSLYLASGASSTVSGRSGEVEYKRTLGAFFALYWLMRLELPSDARDSDGFDGQRGFCFGVNDAWEVPSQAEVVAFEGAPAGSLNLKRAAFFRSTDLWARLQQLFIDAGLLVRARGDESLLEVDEDRMVAMLSLTAIHDIMKIEALLPRVRQEDAPYAGNAAGSQIIDHDLALSYILEKDPEALPSYAVLDEKASNVIRFTQAELGFNHGWLVQAEAPPGAIFNQLKMLLSSKGLTQRDVAFYFVHWVTDLGGSEPTPECGVEKFVIQFPLHVLRSLVSSMSLVQRLALTKPTDLYMEFLEESWRQSATKSKLLPPEAPSEGRVAAMRFLLHAQSVEEQEIVARAFRSMPSDDWDVLSDEMALTGVLGESFYNSSELPAGPAFLLYYAPAFIRLATRHDLAYQEAAKGKSAMGAKAVVTAMRMLAEVYVAARSLWPKFTGAASAETVTIHLGQLKTERVFDIADAYNEGHCWLLTKSSETEGMVQRWPLEKLLGEFAPKSAVLLRLWPSRIFEDANESFASSKMSNSFSKGSTRSRVGFFRSFSGQGIARSSTR